MENIKKHIKREKKNPKFKKEYLKTCLTLELLKFAQETWLNSVYVEKDVRKEIKRIVKRVFKETDNTK